MNLFQFVEGFSINRLQLASTAFCPVLKGQCASRALPLDPLRISQTVDKPGFENRFQAIFRPGFLSVIKMFTTIEKRRHERTSFHAGRTD